MFKFWRRKNSPRLKYTINVYDKPDLFMNAHAVCTLDKNNAYHINIGSGLPMPEIDVVAHELGHILRTHYGKPDQAVNKQLIPNFLLSATEIFGRELGAWDTAAEIRGFKVSMQYALTRYCRRFGISLESTETEQEAK